MRAAVDQRAPPHERHRGHLALLAAPAADDLLGQVHPPVRVIVRGDVGEVGPAVEVRRLVVLVARREGDVAVELEARARARGHGHVGAARPGAVGVVGQLPGLAEVLALGVDLQAGGEELGLEGLGPAAVGQRALRRLGGEAADESVFRRHHGTSSSNVTGPSLTSSTSMCAPNDAAAGPGALAEALVERLGHLGPGRGHERGPVALARVAVERELRDAEDLALPERLVHPARPRPRRSAARGPSRPAGPRARAGRRG